MAYSTCEKYTKKYIARSVEKNVWTACLTSHNMFIDSLTSQYVH